MNTAKSFIEVSEYFAGKDLSASRKSTTHMWSLLLSVRASQIRSVRSLRSGAGSRLGRPDFNEALDNLISVGVDRLYSL
jgi:hypothetical protein